MADLKAQLELSADATGVEAGVGKAKRSLADLGATAKTAGKQASDGLAGMGDGAAVGAEKFNRATKLMIASVERATAAADAGARGTSRYFEVRSAQVGADLGVLRPYLQALDTAREKQEALAASAARANAQANGAAFIDKLREQVATAALGEDALLRYRAAQAGVGAEASHLITQLQNVKAATAAAAAADREATTAAQQQAAALRNAANAQQSFLASLREQVATKGLDASGLLSYRAAQLGVSKEAEGLIAQLGKSDASFGKVGMSAAQMANNLRMVGPQVTDIVTSLQGGQKPLTVFIQQGGQLKDIFGGIGPAARALGGYVAGLISPFTIAGAVVGVLALAYSEGSKEADAFAKAIILSGNAAGVNVGQLQAMAKSISAVVGTQAAAADALAQFAASGLVAGQNLEQFATVAVKFERDTGQAIKATVKQFEELGKDPVDASIKLNESLHYLTLSTYAQIKALDDQGRAADAASAAQKAYADALDSRTTQLEARLGTIERAWLGIKDAAKGAWDAMLNVGRGDSIQDQLAKVNAQIEKARKPFDPSAFGGNAEARAKLQENLALQASLSKRLLLEEKIGGATAATNDQVQARIKFDKDGEQFTTNAAKMEREITKARIEGAAAGAKQSEIESRIADIRKKYTDKGAAGLALGIDKAGLTRDIDAMQKASDKLVSIFSNQEKVLEAQHAVGSLSDAEYYQKKRDLIVVEAEIEDYALQRQIKRFQQEKLSGKDAIDNTRKIVDAEAKLGKLREDTAGKLEVLSTQQEAAVNKLKAAFLSARQAAQDYYDSTQRQQQRELDGIGKGTQTRTLNAGLNQIEDRYAGQRRDLENQKAMLELEGKFTADARAQYDERLRIINEFQGKSISSYQQYYADLLAMQSDASKGASEALANYLSGARDIAKQTEGLTTGLLSGAEDAFVNFAKTGKLSFKSLADFAISELARIAFKAAALNIANSAGSGGGGFLGILGGVAGLFGGTGATASLANSLPGDSLDNFINLNNGFTGKRAAGGPVKAGGLYEVNEKGPELFEQNGRQFLMPGSRGGNVIPNGGAGEPNWTIINHTQGRIDKASVQQLSPTERALVIEQAADHVAAQLGDPNSRVSRSFSGNYSATRKR